MNYLITGGAGFLGLHLAKYLVKKRNRVVLLDISQINKDEYPKGSIFKKTDVRVRQAVLESMKGIDVVVHAAAALPLWKEKDIFEINIEGTRNVLDASLKNKVKHFIYISSTAVYGVPKKHPVYENDPLIGVGAYGKSKIAAEKICEEYRKRDLTVTIIRPKTFVGTHRLGVFEILFDWIKDGKKIPVIGDGNNRYQLLDVDDLVAAIYQISIFNNKEKVNTVFNIGAADFKTVRQDLQELFNYAKSGSAIFPTPSFLVKKSLWIFEKLKVSPLYQWVYDTADKDSFVSILRLTKTLNWKPKYSNSMALIKSYKWYEEHYSEIKAKKTGLTHTTGWSQGILGVFKKLF